MSLQGRNEQFDLHASRSPRSAFRSDAGLSPQLPDENDQGDRSEHGKLPRLARQGSAVVLAGIPVFAALFLMGTTAASQAPDAKPIYLDATQPVEARVDDLMKRMTLKEKIGQL